MVQKHEITVTKTIGGNLPVQLTPSPV